MIVLLHSILSLFLSYDDYCALGIMSIRCNSKLRWLDLLAYFGFENIVNIADETKNPTKTIPKALVIPIIATAVSYMLVAISTSALVGWKELSLSEAPLAFTAEKVFGNQREIILSLIALFATSNTAPMMLIQLL